MRTQARLVQLVSQSALSSVSIARAGGLDHRSRSGAARVRILPRGLHGPRCNRQACVAEPSGRVSDPVSDRPDLTDHRGRCHALRRRDWLRRGPAHVGTDSRPPSPPALHRPGRWPVAGWLALGRLPTRFLPARPRPLSPLPPSPLGAAQDRVRERRAHFFGALVALQDRAAFVEHLAPTRQVDWSSMPSGPSPDRTRCSTMSPVHSPHRHL